MTKESELDEPILLLNEIRAKEEDDYKLTSVQQLNESNRTQRLNSVDVICISWSSGWLLLNIGLY